MKTKRIPQSGRFRIYPFGWDPATTHERCDIQGVLDNGHADIRRHPASGRLQLQFKQPYADLTIVNGERLTAMKTQRLERVLLHLGAVRRIER